jgi:putative molybdopterin biosynthesis protein
VSVLAPSAPTDRSAFDGALGDTSVSIVHVASRELGWVVALGNPLRFSGVHDLTREEVRFVNRPPGSGARAFLEALLARESVETSRVSGWEREETSSVAIAGAVRSGLADAGLATRACATMLGVDFVPVAREDLDLVLRGDFAVSEAGRALLEATRSEAFRSSVATLPGYDADRAGLAKSR